MQTEYQQRKLAAHGSSPEKLDRIKFFFVDNNGMAITKGRKRDKATVITSDIGS
jgi:hypothetical protein